MPERLSKQRERRDLTRLSTAIKRSRLRLKAGCVTGWLTQLVLQAQPMPWHRYGHAFLIYLPLLSTPACQESQLQKKRINEKKEKNGDPAIVASNF